MTYQRDITRKDFISICKELQCTIEPITGGGFLQMDNEAGYKTIRINVQGFPWITPSTMEEWENDETILISVGTKSNTFLKAYDGAPAWSIGELEYYKEVLEKNGIKCTKMPTARSLINSS
jgi:hypothetical protein